MKLKFESNGEVTVLDSVSEHDLENVINRLDSATVLYVILENENGDYIQCASGVKGFVVEVRWYEDDKSFKHYVIGKYPLSKIWTSHKGGVGAISVLDNEILAITSVRELFEFFLKTSEVHGAYNKRNITKLFLRGGHIGSGRP